MSGCAAGSPPPALTPSSGHQGAGPGDVALGFARSVFDGDVTRARTYVLPRDVDVYQVLFAGIPKGSFKDSNLAVGSVSVERTTARVVLTGTLCHRAAAFDTQSTP